MKGKMIDIGICKSPFSWTGFLGELELSRKEQTECSDGIFFFFLPNCIIEMMANQKAEIKTQNV